MIFRTLLVSNVVLEPAKNRYSYDDIVLIDKNNYLII